MAFKFINNPRDYGINYTIVNRDGTIPSGFGTPQMREVMQKTHDEGEEDHGSLMVDITSTAKLSRFIEDEMETETDQKASVENGSSFSGTESLEEALDVIKEGEEDILREVEEKSADIIAKNTELIPEPFGVQRDVEGNYFDVGLYLSGEPEAFYKEKNQLVGEKVVTLNIQASYVSHVDKDRVIDKIIYLFAAVRIMEKAGYSVGINMYWLSKNPSSSEKRNFFCRYKIKSPKTPLNLKRLVGTAHPSFFRRVLFRVKELTDCDPGGYGRSLDDIEGMFELACVEEDVKSIIEQIIGDKEIEKEVDEGSRTFAQEQMMEMQRSLLEQFRD